MAILTLKSMTSAAKCQMHARLRDFKNAGLVKPPDVGAIMIWTGSMVGKDCAILAQLAPIILHGLVSNELLAVWKALGTLHELSYRRVLGDVEQYAAEMEACVQDVIRRVSIVNYTEVTRVKFHLLLHLARQSIMFGPPVLIATEANEKYNQPIREKIYNTNRRNPSSDIAKAFTQYRALRHISSGGCWKDDTGSVLQGGRLLQELVENSDLQQILKLKVSNNREWRYHGRNHVWDLPGAFEGFLDGGQVRSFSRLSDKEGKSTGVGGFCIDKSDKIWRIEGIFTKTTCEGNIWILGKHYNAADVGHPTGCPQLVATDEVRMMTVEVINGILNVQHDCTTDGCQYEGSETYQFNGFKGSIRHRDTTHYLLNIYVLMMPWLSRWRKVPQDVNGMGLESQKQSHAAWLTDQQKKKAKSQQKEAAAGAGRTSPSVPRNTDGRKRKRGHRTHHTEPTTSAILPSGQATAGKAHQNAKTICTGLAHQ